MKGQEQMESTVMAIFKGEFLLDAGSHQDTDR